MFLQSCFFKASQNEQIQYGYRYCAIQASTYPELKNRTAAYSIVDTDPEDEVEDKHEIFDTAQPPL